MTHTNSLQGNKNDPSLNPTQGAISVIVFDMLSNVPMTMLLVPNVWM